MLAIYREQWPRVGAVLAMVLGGASVLAVNYPLKAGVVNQIDRGSWLSQRPPALGYTLAVLTPHVAGLCWPIHRSHAYVAQRGLLLVERLAPSDVLPARTARLACRRTAFPAKFKSSSARLARTPANHAPSGRGLRQRSQS